MIAGIEHEVNRMETQMAAISAASEKVWAVAMGHNKGTLLSVALDLMGAIAAAQSALTFLVNATPAAATNEEIQAVRRWEHQSPMEIDVDFEAEVDRHYQAWLDGQDEKADALAGHWGTD